MLNGQIDSATRDRVRGWAFETDTPDVPVSLLVIDNGDLIARVIANIYRIDLEAAGIGSGRCSFDFAIPNGLSAHRQHLIEVVRESDGVVLANSPMAVDASTEFDAALEASLGAALQAETSIEELDRRLAFLARQTEALLQRRADVEGQRGDRLAHESARHRSKSSPADTAAAPPLRALVIDDTYPNPTRDAGSRAVVSHMTALRELGYDVSFATSYRDDSEAGRLEALGFPCWRRPHYASVEDVLQRQAGCFDLIYLHRISSAGRYMALARLHDPLAKILYSVADLYHVRFGRQGTAEGRADILALGQRLRVEELTAAWLADIVVTHSTEEAALLAQAVPPARVHVVPWHVPLQPTEPPFAARHGVAFIGGFRHRPNIDGAVWLAETIMPLVWQHMPDMECLLVGSQMPTLLTNLAAPKLLPLGYVEDLATIFSRVRLTVAPLRYGAGVKGKVLESFAAGVPCVMSPFAAEGVAFPPTLQSLVAADAEGIAAAISRLHGDAEANESAAAAGLELMRSRFDADAVREAMAAAIAPRGSTPANTAGETPAPASKARSRKRERATAPAAR